jgi:hypothetical protein
MLGRCEQKVRGVILPKDRGPRFVTIRRGETLTDSDHQLLALWAASRAEHVLDLFESARPEDPRPRQGSSRPRAWVRGEITMSRTRTRPARPRSSYTSPRTNWVRPPMGSRPHVLPRRKEWAAARGDLSACGSATSSRSRFASSSSTTSGCGTTSAGQCLTAESGVGALALPSKRRLLTEVMRSADGRSEPPRKTTVENLIAADVETAFRVSPSDTG